MHNLLDEAQTRNSEEPKWLVIHYPDRPKRQRWLRDLAESLVAHDWVIWRDGDDAHVKHRALMTH